ncbi:hypothetical protein [Providencia manganoxydans]|uniref:hypothetical protein n=1 Tax=Providencia manganoxydans TaxID=2923283 RepID=UPI0034DD55D2
MSFAIPQLQNLLYQQQTKLFEHYSKILMIKRISIGVKTVSDTFMEMNINLVGI